MKYNEMVEKLINDSIKNEELIDCLNSNQINIIGMAVLKIIERKYCDEPIVGALKKIASLLSGWKAVGPYQIGHLAAAALFLVRDQAALDCFSRIYDNLKEIDKYLIDNFIEQYEKTP